MKNLLVNMSFNRELYKNKLTGDQNIYDLADAELIYNMENSPWTITLSFSNIFDVSFKRNDVLNDFIISDKRIYIMPRIGLLKISYKF